MNWTIKSIATHRNLCLLMLTAVVGTAVLASIVAPVSAVSREVTVGQGPQLNTSQANGQDPAGGDHVKPEVQVRVIGDFDRNGEVDIQEGVPGYLIEVNVFARDPTQGGAEAAAMTKIKMFIPWLDPNEGRDLGPAKEEPWDKTEFKGLVCNTRPSYDSGSIDILITWKSLIDGEADEGKRLFQSTHEFIIHPKIPMQDPHVLKMIAGRSILIEHPEYKTEMQVWLHCKPLVP